MTRRKKELLNSDNKNIQESVIELEENILVTEEVVVVNRSLK